MKDATYSLKVDALDDTTQPFWTVVEREGLSLDGLLEHLRSTLPVVKPEQGSEAPLAFDVTIERHDS